MENDAQTKSYDHDRGGLADKIALVGELEHIRRHALRSAVVMAMQEKDEAIHYLVWAQRAQTARRELMKKMGDIEDPMWCLCKSAACLRQLSYEVAKADQEMLVDIDSLVDDIWGYALNADLSDCAACRDDKNSDKETE